MSLPSPFSSKNPSVLKIFNSISDLNDTQEVNKAIKTLPSVSSRLQLIDKLLKRKAEIQKANELSQITKLAPVFTRLKQKFLQKLRMSRMAKNKSSIITGPLFQKPLAEDKGQQEEFVKNRSENAKKGTVVRMIASFNDHGIRKGNIITVDSLSSLVKNEPFENNQGNNTMKNVNSLNLPKENPKKNKSLLCKFSRVLSENSQYEKVLEKELVNFARNDEKTANILEINSPCKSLEHFDRKIKQKLANFLKQKPISMKKNEEKPSGLNQIKTYSSILSNHNQKKTFKKTFDKEDESYVSFTEIKLVSLYKESKKMKEETEVNEKKKGVDRHMRDVQRGILRNEMKRNLNEIIGLIKRKLIEKEIVKMFYFC